MTRSKKAIINITASLLSEIATIICGFIVPRLILTYFGSKYNGVTSSITQFLGIVALLNIGVSGAARVAYYKPLAEKKNEDISKVAKSVERYTRMIALYFAGALIVFACIYPLIIKGEFPWLFSFSMVLILGISTFMQYYFGIAYQILLSSDQRNYIVSLSSVFTIVLNTIVAVILIKAGCPINVVKLGSAVVYTMKPLFLNYYVKRHYHLDGNVKPEVSLLKERKYAIGHTLANYIRDKTDIVVLTLFSSLMEVSVYSVYMLVTANLRAFIHTISSSLVPTFGNMYAKDEHETMKTNLFLFEHVIYSLSCLVFLTAIFSILSFVQVYTRGVTDTNYYRPDFATLMVLAEFIFCIRMPYYIAIQASGMYRQTMNTAYIEACINVMVSLAMVTKFGIVGVAVGTVVSIVFCTVRYMMFVYRNFLDGEYRLLIKRWMHLIAICVTSILARRFFITPDIMNFSQWIVHTALTFAGVAIIVILFSFLFYRTLTLSVLRRLSHLRKPVSIKNQGDI